MRHRHCFTKLAIAFVMLSAVVRLAAQSGGGAFSGTVTDKSGAVIPHARIVIRSIATAEIRSATTNQNGFYTVPNLRAGQYEISASASGFAQARVVTALAVGEEEVVNVVISPGSGVGAVQNRSAGAGLHQSSSAVSGNVSSQTVRQAPLNGRDWTQLATLQAGVIGIQTANSGAGKVAQRGFGASMSISGGRPDQNGYLLDGISINDYSNAAPGSVLGANLGVDAVQQFSVLESNYPANYGRTSGGILNAITRSGTNSFHGDAYEFIRNSSFDARNFFDAKIPPFRRNQFGASAGGPIRHDKTFFFADYEGLRQSLGVTTVDTVPSPAARNGQLSTGRVAVDPQVARYLQAFYPLPNAPLPGGDTGIYTFAAQQVTPENYFTTRIDHKLSGKDNLSGTYVRDNSETTQPDSYDEILIDVISHRQIAVLGEQHTFGPALVNAFRIGFDRSIAIDGGVARVINPLLADPSFDMIPGQFAGQISSIPGVTDFGGGPNARAPGSYNSSKQFYWNSFQGYDDAFLTKGIHSIKFGVALERMQDNQLATGNSNGAFSFSSLPAFLTNKPLVFQGQGLGAINVFGTRETLFGAYAEDDLRARPNLTLNLGLRYEMTTAPTEAHNRIANLIHLTDANPHLGSPYFSNPTLNNFEPRVGFAWDPTRAGKMAVRGGFGVFDVLPLPYEFSIITPYAAPFYEVINSTSLPPGSFPAGAFQLASSNPSLLRTSYVEQNPQRNYVMQWNLSAERQLAPSLVATLGYIGSRGVHQPYRADDFDTVLPAITSVGLLYPPTATSLPLNLNFGRISGMVWQSNSFYDALELTLSKTMSHGFQIQGSYTWGKSIDTSSVTIAGDALSNAMPNMPFFDPQLNRALSDFNVGQNLEINYTWQVPSPHLRFKPAAWGLSGWQLGGIYKASSGVPFTPQIGGDPLGTKLSIPVNDVPDWLITQTGCGSLANPGNPNDYIRSECLAFPSPSNLRGNLGRNVLLGPGTSDLDFSLIKNNPVRVLSEAVNVQFRAEFFNIFNRPNFAQPLNHLEVFNPTGSPVAGAGLITSTQTPAREIQLALKVTW
ncbi:MAG: carboxypeptidase regulatory-like domain-containing protein [Terriglobia bacterium]